jgi:hypothetical protein
VTQNLVLGLPLNIPDRELEGTPLCAFVVVKLLNADGRVCHVAAATPDFTPVECLGMARWAMLKLEHGLLAEFEEDDDK